METSATNYGNNVGQKGHPNYQILRDPDLAKNRIYVGNLPLITKPQLESICQPYGNILAAVALKNFGFVQFETEAEANKAIAAINGSTFKGTTITCQSATLKPTPSVKRPQNVSAAPTVLPEQVPAGDYNDCEIIVLDRNNTEYAEYVEMRLKRLNLRVDLLFPNADVPLGKVLSNISARRCLYAVLVTNQHQELNSITVNILYGAPAEHRNMPIEDAIALIANDFRRKMLQDSAKSASMMNLRPSVSSVPTSSLTDHPMPIIPAIKDRHPENIQVLINLLADNVRLTVLQFNCIIKYLQDLREDQIKVELGSAAAISKPKTPDPEIELQKRILDILNKPSVADNRFPLMYPTLDSVKNDSSLIALLNDGRVQRAIDSLMDSNLVSTIQEYMKF